MNALYVLVLCVIYLEDSIFFVASVMAAQAQKESAKAVAAASSSVVEEEEECFGPIPIAKLEVSFLSVYFLISL